MEIKWRGKKLFTIALLCFLLAGCNPDSTGKINGFNPPSWIHGEWADDHNNMRFSFSGDNVTMQSSMMGVSIDYKDALKSNGSVIDEDKSQMKYAFSILMSKEKQTFQFSKQSAGSLTYKLTTGGITQGPFKLNRSSPTIIEPIAPLRPYEGKSFTINNNLLAVQIDERGWVLGATLKAQDGAEKLSETVMGEAGSHSVYMNSIVNGAREETPYVIEKHDSNILVLSRSITGGLKQVTTISLTDGSYLIDVQDRIVGGADLKMFRQLVERNPDRRSNASNEHVGPIGQINNMLKEIDYDDLDSRGIMRMASMGGWTGIAYRQFVVAIISNPDRDTQYYYKSDGRSYQSGLINDGDSDGNDVVFRNSIFIGKRSMMAFEIGR